MAVLPIRKYGDDVLRHPAEPVAEITIASNLIDMFTEMEAGSDLVFRRGTDAPTLLIPEMTVGAA